MIYNQIFTELKEALSEKFPGITVKQEYQPEENEFPLVTFEEHGVALDVLDNDDIPYATSRTFTANIYTNDLTNKKYKARYIAMFMIEFLYKKNMICRFSAPVPNAADNTIYRIRQNYSVGVTKNNEFYRK